MQALVELALAINEKEENTDKVSDLVADALEKHRKERQEAASNDIVALLRRIDSHKREERRVIRELKSKLNTTVEGLKVLDRQWDYAQETNNFMPVLKFFGEVRPSDLENSSEFEKLTTVPDDWEPAKK